MAGRLHVVDGRLKGPASITYNNPWPCPNGQWGMRIPHGVMGVVMHTMVGNLPGTISVFNNPGYQASAHFGIDQNGHIHQFGPVNGWVAWAEEAGNENWYSIEHADNGNPDNPLTDAQITASARVVEALSAFASFPLREANRTSERGYGVHYMGGAEWGGHSCPDQPPRHVRSHQRPEILRRAGAIRHDQHTPPPPPPLHETLVTDGTLGLAAFAANSGVQAADMLSNTVEAAANGEYVPALATYIDTVFGTDTVEMPDDLVWYYQQKSPTGQSALTTWQTGPANHPQDPQPLSALAAFVGTDAQSVISLTAENSPGKAFQAAAADYINGVFSRSEVLLPAGLTLRA